jgi:predicted RNA-binding Zn-ribbon protein involved in translation (DUF1610 family)
MADETPAVGPTVEPAMTDASPIDGTLEHTTAVMSAPGPAAPSWRCPKDGTVMTARGRRQGAWRCPDCGGMFLDLATIRGARRPMPAWAPVVVSVLTSLLVTWIVRRLRHRQAT